VPATAAMTEPEELVLSSALVTPEIAKPVVVADVPVAMVKVRSLRVEEPVAKRLAVLVRPVTT